MKILKKKIILGSFIACMLVSKISNAFVLSDIKIAPEIGLNFSSGNILKVKKTELGGLLAPKESYSIPWNIGIVLGYRFLEFLESEIGLKYCHDRSVTVEKAFTFQEKALDIPLKLNYVSSITPLIKIKGTLGYKASWILTSKYIVKDKTKAKVLNFGIQAFEESVNDLKKGNKDFPSLEHYVLIGSGVEFPYGIYFNFILSIPLASKDKIEKDNEDLFINKKNEAKPQDKRFFSRFRFNSSPRLNLQLGINIMSFF